jgi:hypothetical protein
MSLLFSFVLILSASTFALEAGWLAAIDGGEPVRRPTFLRTTHPEGSTHSTTLPIEVSIRHGSAPVVSGTLQFSVDNQDVTHLCQVSSNAFGVVATAHPRLSRNSSHTYEVKCIAGDDPTYINSDKSSFSTDARGPGDRFIELEDYNFDGSKSRDKANDEDYKGGAFEGEKAKLGIDYQTEFLEPDVEKEIENDYRPNEERVTAIVPGTDVERSGFLMDTSWLLLGRPGAWFQYTRHFPSGWYFVYAALSYGGIDYGKLSGSLLRSVLSEGSQPSLESLGVFLAEGSGAWGKNTLVPLRLPGDDKPVQVYLQGPTTFRYEFASGAGDYLLFVPSVLLKAISLQNGDMVVEWFGEATLMEAQSLEDGFKPVPGSTVSPFRFKVSPSEAQHYFKLVPVGASVIDD